MDKVKTIINICAEFYGVTPEEILQPYGSNQANKRRKVLARQSAMIMMVEYLKMSKTEVGNYIGGRDHSTVIHAETTISDLMDSDREFKREFERLKKLVKWTLRRKKEVFNPHDVYRKFGYMFI
jgi:chromosomal replication initiator protein